MADWFVVAPRGLTAAIALFLIALVSAPVGAARAETVVSPTFDDGAVSQLAARDELAARGMHGTFFINSGNIEPPDNPYFMTWSQLASVAANGNEIGGHTVADRNLVTGFSSDSARKAAICDDRQTLEAHGYRPVSFAYPHGAFNPTVQSLVQQCGYASARTVGGFTEPGCDPGVCQDTQSIPPADWYAVRTNSYTSGQMTLGYLQGLVIQAQEAGGGWVPLMFHDICNVPCTGMSEDGSISRANFGKLLDWLGQNGIPVRTVRSVRGLDPPPAPALPPPVSALASSSVDRVTAFASVKAGKRQDVDKLFVSAAMVEPGTLSATGTVVLSNASRVFKLKGASKAASPGKRVKLRLKLSKKGLRAAKRAIRAHRRVRAKITISAADGAGNTKRAKRTVRLID